MGDDKPKAAPASTFEGHVLPGEGHTVPHWSDGLDGRICVHIAYARTYAADYAHGAPGHLDLMTIAALAKLLDQYQGSVPPQELPRA